MPLDEYAYGIRHDSPGPMPLGEYADGIRHDFPPTEMDRINLVFDA